MGVSSTARKSQRVYNQFEPSLPPSNSLGSNAEKSSKFSVMENPRLMVTVYNTRRCERARRVRAISIMFLPRKRGTDHTKNHLKSSSGNAALPNARRAAADEHASEPSSAAMHASTNGCALITA